MTIVLLNDAAYIRGGADRVVFDSARGLAARGHRVILFTAFGPAAPEIADCPGVELHCLGDDWLRQSRNARSAIKGMWNVSAAAALRAVLASCDPRSTVVHAHLYSSALSASVLHTAHQAGFGTLLTLHDYFITCPNGAYFVFPTATVCERRALSPACLSCHCDSRRRLHKLWRVGRTWIQNRMARIPEKIDLYLAVSPTCANLAKRHLPASARIARMDNIVSVPQRTRAAVSSHKTLLFSGRLESYKGPHLLAQAASRTGQPVTFCGSGPMESELRKLLPTASFPGWVSPEQILKALQEARAFIFPSIYRETFGLSAAEALACGVPVVASRGTAAEDFVVHEKNGLLFRHNSVDDLAEQLERLKDDVFVDRLGAEAYRRYWEHPLTESRHLETLEGHYNSVLQERNRSRFPVVQRQPLAEEAASP